MAGKGKGSALRRIEGIGQGSLSGTLMALLSLTSDAVLVFDGSGKVLLANDEAMRLLPHDGDTLVGADVRTLFPPAVGQAPQTPFDAADLPFPLDGTTARMVGVSARGAQLPLVMRCQEVRAPGTTYLLVAHADGEGAAAAHEHDRLVDELSRANHRLSGTLKIVLDTIDSDSVGTLFDRVLEELTDTMDASGCAVYIAERDGYHLRGTSSSLDGARVPRFMSFGRSLERLTTKAGHAMRLRVLPPSGKDLRRGHVTQRDVVDEETREVYRLSASVLPPFASFIAVPVWFGKHVIALIELGWEKARQVGREDAELLDAVTQYLSVQLAGAFAAMRSHREEHLRQSASEIREMAMAAPKADEELLARGLDQVGEALDAAWAPVSVDEDAQAARHVVTAELPVQGTRELSLDLSAVEEGHVEDGVCVVAIQPQDDLSRQLADLGEPCYGALMDIGKVGGERVCVLILRGGDSEPLDEVELAYLRRVASDARGIAAGEEARKEDQHISQALQTGMRNELQQVDGISADGIYSSATKSAFVGGDFYDLIRLPDHRACVIMGDVSGKGVEAASVSAAVKTALGAYSWQGLGPARMVRLLNDFLLGFSRIETFATLFVGIVDQKSATLTYCSAGHPPAILIRARTGAIETLDVQSGVVGAFHDMTYRNGRARLSKGDMLLLYTDGTTEARARDGAFFGEDGLRDAVTREAPKGFEGLLKRLLRTLDVFTDNDLEDDVAMVALRFDRLGPAVMDEDADKGGVDKDDAKK